MLIVTELFDLAVNDIEAKKSSRYSRVLAVTELVVSGIQCSYRPKRSFGQGNIFTPVCHSVHRGGVGCPGGVSAPNFRGGVCLVQIFRGEGRGMSGPNLGGGVCSKFSGGCLLQIFLGGSSNFRNTVNVWPVCILLECILVVILF